MKGLALLSSLTYVGLSFSSFPYVLMVHLKRFGYDWKTDRRYKLHHYVSFPYYINVQQYVGQSTINAQTQSTTTEIDRKIEVLQKQIQNYRTLMDKLVDEGQMELVDMHHAVIKEREAELARLNAEAGTKVQSVDGTNKPGNYELYAVLVHSGSAQGGHYYVYIKSFEDYKWRKFDDSHVTDVTESAIEETFGVKDSSTSYSSTAYLLMYRQIEKGNVNVVPTSDIPACILKIRLFKFI
jgi:ubiquitin carboxyl-terminal hydrolase 47